MAEWFIFRAPRVPGCPRHPLAQRPCQVLAEGRGPGPRNVLIQFEDGHRLVTIHRRKSLRPLFAREQQLELGL